MKLSYNCDVLMLELDTVTALGIVIAELVANSYEHAVPDGKSTIDVAVRHSPGNPCMATIVVSDNGQGFEIQPGSKRHGLGLVRRLAEQVRGTASVSGANGAVWTLSFRSQDRNRLSRPNERVAGSTLLHTFMLEAVE